jgi:hypothetical protein
MSQHQRCLGCQALAYQFIGDYHLRDLLLLLLLFHNSRINDGLSSVPSNCCAMQTDCTQNDDETQQIMPLTLGRVIRGGNQFHETGFIKLETMVSQKKSRRRKLEVTHETKVAQQSFF